MSRSIVVIIFFSFFLPTSYLISSLLLGLKVDNASITGESLPLSRTIRASSGPILEAKNMAFFATSVVEGRTKLIFISFVKKVI